MNLLKSFALLALVASVFAFSGGGDDVSIFRHD